MAQTYHDVHLSEDPDRKIVWIEIAHYLSGFIPEGASVLELGAGYCDWINHVRAPERVATDQWEGIERYASPGVKSVVGDVRDSLRSFGPKRFDVILASNFFEHFTHDELEPLLDCVRERLREDGRLIAIQPNFRYAYRRYFDDYTHRAVFTDLSFQAFLRAKGFCILHAEPRFLPLTMKSRLPKWGWLVRAYLRLLVRPLAGQMLVVAQRDSTEGD